MSRRSWNKTSSIWASKAVVLGAAALFGARTASADRMAVAGLYEATNPLEYDPHIEKRVLRKLAHAAH